jgi:hypothetical protein
MNHDTETHTAPAAPADDTELLATSVVKTPDLAWSAADDTPTIAAYQPRRGRWLIAIAAMLIGLAAAAGTSLYYTQQHQPPNPTTHPAPTMAPPPKPAPPPAPKPENKDELFVRVIKAGGITPLAPADVLGAQARSTCTRLEGGESREQAVAEILDGTPAFNEQKAINWVDASIGVFCPDLQH